MVLEDWEYKKGTYTNIKTGEVLEYFESRQEIDKAEFEYEDGRFARMYLSTAQGLPLLIKREQKLLWYLVSNMNYDNVYLMDIGGRERIARETDMAMNTVNSSLSGLYKKEIVFKLARGRVQVSQKYFSKGSARRVMAIKSTLSRIDGKYFEITEMAVRPKKQG